MIRVLWISLVCLLNTACDGVQKGLDVTAIIGVRATIGPLDPAVAPSVEQTILLPPVYERLFSISSDPKTGADVFTPQLAKSWSVSDDGLLWTFTLNKGHRFSDGTPVTSEAVKFTFDRAMAISRGPAAPLKAIIETIDTPDDETVIFRLKATIFSLLPILSDRVGFILNPSIMTHEIDGDQAMQWLSENTAGSGPYQLTKFSPRDSYILEPNPHYNGEIKQIEKIIFREINDASVRALLMKGQDLDLAFFLSPESLPAFEKDENFTVHMAPTLAFHNLALNVESKVFSDIRLRKAAAYAMDVDAIVDVLKEGRARPLKGPLPSGMLGAAPDLYPYTYDPDRAREMIADTGAAPEDLKISLVYPGVSSSADTMAVFMQANLEAVGFDVTLQRLTLAAMLDRVQRGAYDALFMGWVSPYADASNIMNFWFDPEKIGPAGNSARYKNTVAAELINASLYERDKKVRAEIIREAIEIVNADTPYVYLTQNNIWTVSGPRLKNYQMDPRDPFNIPYHNLVLTEEGTGP